MNSRRRGAVLIAAACAASLARADDVSVRLQEQTRRIYEIEGVFEVKASSTCVWNVLTDYDHIPQFVPSMRQSRVLKRGPDGTAVVEQEAIGRSFFLSKKVRVTLDIKREPDRLSFEDTLRQDFEFYRGSWEARTGPDGIQKVDYRLRAEPSFRAPSFVLRRSLKRGARDLLEQVRAEILQRCGT